MEIVTSTNIYFERKQGPLIPVKECIETCAQAGYRYMDFGFAELALSSEQFAGEKWKKEILNYKRLARRKGVSFVQAHATIFDFCNPDDDYAYKEKLFQRSIRGAKILGADWIVVHPSTGVKNGKQDRDTHKRNVAFFKRYSEYANSYGVGIAIENMWGRTKEGIPHYAVEAEELLRLVEDVGCENIKICWDVEHGSIENLNQAKAIHLLDGHITATHISDEAGVNNIHILPYLGRGKWEEILTALADIQYNGTFDFEIQHYLPGVPKELIPSAMRFSFEVGNYMVRRLESLKRRRKAKVENE